ncbi:MAG: hypothetical protein JWR73_2687, partial [Tardiphaga sp.]|nr:hypothetical protein [Tardiphaga sp.]
RTTFRRETVIFLRLGAWIAAGCKKG